jgi:autotransporter-associated beta strand protein
LRAEAGSGYVAFLGNVGLVKSTRATVVLSSSNRYTGTTTIGEGLLVINGEHTGGGEYKVACSGVLGGTGLIDETVIVDGSVAPGALVGTLTVGDAEFRSDSRLLVELVGSDVDRLNARHLSIASRAELHIAAHRGFVPGVYVIGQYTSRAGEFRLRADSNFSVEYVDSLGLILLIARPK